ncbi:uncharacterized protein LOC119720750 [Patiria miniata]|uniref:Uncharacterized protein n=1 Tax=Patiria miniata TaxID=46514 RepID=A0A913Z6Q9_PATMI|nr:uncharacterized protein LOC119720750 [Patiria miniata]
MNKLSVFVVCCLFLQLASGLSLSRHESTRSKFDDLLQKLIGGRRTGQPTTQAGQLYVPAIIRYSTTKTETLAEDEDTWFIGELCGNAMGKAVNVTMQLDHNPGWDPVKGVVNYEVIDSNYQDRVLCTNKDSNGYATPYCLVENWPNQYDIIILAKAGPVSGIAFGVDAEFFEPDSLNALQIKANVPNHPLPKTVSIKGFNPQALSLVPIPLTETVSVYPSVSLSYQEEAMIQYTWCSNSETHAFSVESTVTSADGESTYTQYICDKLPCDVGLNNIAHNGEQLTSNAIVTDPMAYKTLYIVVVNWGGAYDEEAQAYVGNFLYNANQVKII